MFWKFFQKQISLERPCYLGIINLTPDSFSDGGEFFDTARAVEHGKYLLSQGAALLDIGAESTRPGSCPVAPEEEWARLEPVIRTLRQDCPQCRISIDTRHSETALRALDNGVDVINDVTGFQSSDMLKLVKKSECGLIAMRARMDKGSFLMPDYFGLSPRNDSNVIQELCVVKNRLLDANIEPERVLLDTGFGFGTTFSEDCALWDTLEHIPVLIDWPVERFCIAVSRKRFVANFFGVNKNELLDIKTSELHKKAASIGFRVFRSHSVQGVLNEA